jgi:hypothetical protein
MLSAITSIPNRVAAFVNRNKGKLVAGAVLVGGVWYYYRDTIKQAFEMYQLIQEMSANSENIVPTNSSEDSEAYRQTVATGDETSQKNFNSIRLHRADMYSDELDRIQANLRSAVSNESERASLFAELSVLTFSRLLLSLYVVIILLLLSRIQVCLIGKANRVEVSEDTKADHRELLSALRHVTSRDGMMMIDSMIRRIAREKLVSPTKIMNRNELSQLFMTISEDILDNLKNPSHAGGGRSSASQFSWLLGRLALDPPEEQSTVCKETLDILESPQFSSVLLFLVKQSVTESIKRSLPDSVGASFPLAVLIPGIKAEAESVTAINGPHVVLFQSTNVVDELCRAVYLSDSTASSAPDQEDLDLMAQLNGDDANMAKLGELLEKLVKADLKSPSIDNSSSGQ